jgi:hypothetical protein
LGAYLYMARQSAAAVEQLLPWDAVRSEDVAPDLAVLTLAGETDDRVIRAALQAGEIETAYAGLAYSVLLPDAVRTGHWLLLADHFAPLDEKRAGLCYRVALDLAALSPELNDMARADASLQVARGYLALGQPWAARLALAQAENIARYSLTLVPAQRQTILKQITAMYRQMGDKQAVAALGEQGPAVRLSGSPPLLPTLRGTVVLPASVTAAIVTRQVAAAQLASHWPLSAPSARTALAEELAQALVAEDRARSEFYAEAGQLPMDSRLALLHDQITWLTIKYRVARGAYGMTLVPDWSDQSEAIHSALVTAYTDLINGYGQQLDTLGPAEAVPARVELLRQGLLWTRLGLFPDHAEEALSQQLSEASRQLWTRQGGAGLTIVVQQAHGQRFYLLSGSAPPTEQPVPATPTPIKTTRLSSRGSYAT